MSINNINVLENHCKMNDKTLHLLPFSASRNRKKDFEIEKQWGKFKLNLTAAETMNVVDLITLSQMLQDYQRNPSLWTDGGNIDSMVVLKRTLNIPNMVVSKELRNVRGNRETILNSIDRWYKSALKFTNLETGVEQNTRYIYQYTNVDPKKITDVIIFVHKGFLEFCLKNGLMFNFKRLMLYKNSYAQLLDAFLQGTKTVGAKKSGYRYRQAYSENLLLQAIGLTDSEYDGYEQRKRLKNAFSELTKIGGLPVYVFDKINVRWVRNDSKISAK